MGRVGGRPAVDYRRLAAADVSDLSLGVDALGTDFRALHSELLSFGGYRAANVRRVSPAQLTPDWLQQSGGFRPVMVPAAPGSARELGMALPEGTLSVDRLASKIGLPFEVHTMDAQTQGEGPRWTLHQWCLYWDARRAASREPLAGLAAPAGGAAAGAADPASAALGTAAGGGVGSAQQGTPRRPAPAEDEADSAAVKRKRSAEEEAAAQQLKGISTESKKRVLEVAALPLAGTPIEAEFSPPAAVRAVDLAQQVWPEGAPSRPVAGVTLVMSPEGAYTDFHLAAGGASVWLHCVSGRRSLALVPPTPRNLATYVAWAASARYAGVFLPAHCEGAIRVEVGPGDTLIIPPGWAHASATTSSAVLLGGSFLRRDGLAMHLEAWRIEDHLAVRPRFRLPAFKQAMWYAAAAFSKRLRRLAGLSCAELRERTAAQLAALEREEEAAAAARAGGSQGAGDSDSVSKAGAAKRRKGWQGAEGDEPAGRGKEVADDARSKPPEAAAAAGRGMEPPAQRGPQMAAGMLARPNGSPLPAPGPRQVGRAVGGGSRLHKAAAAAGGARAGGGRALGQRMNPTQLTVDMRGGGGGGGGGGGARGRAKGGGGGGGFGKRKRERSVDSFIEQDSGEAAGSDGAAADDSDAEGVEWAPGGAAGRLSDEDEEMSDAASDDDDALEELAAAARRRRFGGEGEEEQEGAGGAGRPRRMTARQAAREAAMAEAWDGRIAARGAAGRGRGLPDEDEEEEWEVGEEEDEEGYGGGGGGRRRGRQSTRFRGQLPPRLAAMLQEEEGEEAAEDAFGAGGPAGGTAPAAAFAAAEPALAAFAAAGVAAAPQPAPPAGLRAVKIKVRPPASPGAPAAAAGMAAAQAQQVQQPAFEQQFAQQQFAQQQQQQQPGSAKLKIKIKPATIPQVDGAGDDPLQAMYDALFDEKAEVGQQEGQRQAQQQQQPSQGQQPGQQQQAAPPGQSPFAAAGEGAEPSPRQPGAAQHAEVEAAGSLELWLQQAGSAQQQAAGEQVQRQASQGGGAAQPAQQQQEGQDAGGGGRARSPSPFSLRAGGADEELGSPAPLVQHADSSQGQLAAGGGEDSVGARKSASRSPSVEGPPAPGRQQGGSAAAAAAGGEAAAAAAQQEQQAVVAQLRAEHNPAGSSGAPSPVTMARAAAGHAAAEQPAAATAPEPAVAAAAVAAEAAAGTAAGAGEMGVDDEEEEEEREDEASAPAPEPLSLEEEEGLAALLAALKQWLRAPHALNDVPLTISNPKTVVARLEACMRALGLSLAPPPPVDFESVPLERLLPVRTPRAGTLGLPPSHQTPQPLSGSEFVPGELDAVGEGEEGGEFDPDDLLEEGGPGGVVVEESAGPKNKHALAAPSAAKQAGGARGMGAGMAGRGGAVGGGGAAGRAPARQQKKMSVKDRLKKKLHLK